MQIVGRRVVAAQAAYARGIIPSGIEAGSRAVLQISGTPFRGAANQDGAPRAFPRSRYLRSVT
jgi:hypothetical protein